MKNQSTEIDRETVHIYTYPNTYISQPVRENEEIAIIKLMSIKTIPCIIRILK